MTVPINYRIPFRLCCFVSWTMWLRIFAGRFYTRNNRSLNVCMTVLRRVQKVIERLHGGFARVQKGLEVSSWGGCTCTKGPWSWFKGFCVVYKRVLKLVQGVLHVYKKALKLVQGAFARVQKGIERCKWLCLKLLHRLFVYFLLCFTDNLFVFYFTSQILYRFPKIFYRIVWLFLI